MNLHQEYIFRKTHNVPVVLYKPETFIVLKSKEEKNVWRTLSIQWKQKGTELGIYNVIFKQSIPNSWSPESSWDHSSCFLSLERSGLWEWDEYERNIFDIVENIRTTCFYTISQKEVSINIWKMFLSIIEKFAVDNLDIKYFIDISNTLKKNILSESDIIKIQEIIRGLKSNYPCLFSFWHNHFLPNMIDSCDSQWLLEIIDEKI